MEDSLISSKREDEKELRLYRKIAYAAGNFLTVSAISLWFPYSVLFFTKVLKIPHGVAGNIILVGQAGGAISTPFVGMWSDQCFCRIPGRRKIFHLMGLFFTSVVFFFIWHECFRCEGANVSYKLLYFGSFVIVFQFGWAATQIGQLALLPELTSVKRIMVELNSLRYCFTVTANIYVFGCFWGLLEKFGTSDGQVNENDKEAFWIMALIVVVVGVLVSLPFQFLVPEKSNVQLKRLQWYRWFLNPRLYLTALLLIGSRYIVLLPQTYMPLYFQETLKMDKGSIAKGPLVLYISSFFTTLILKKIRNIIGDKMTYFIGLAVVWGALIFFWVKEPSDPNNTSSKFYWPRDCVYIATILLGIGGAVVVVIALSMIAYLIQDYKGSSAFVYGWVLFADRLSNGVGVWTIQYLTPAQDLRGEYYRHVLVYVPFVGSGLGLLILIIFALLDMKKRKQADTIARTSDQQVAIESEESKSVSSLVNSVNYGINSTTENVQINLSFEDSG